MVLMPEPDEEVPVVLTETQLQELDAALPTPTEAPDA